LAICEHGRFLDHGLVIEVAGDENESVEKPVEYNRTLAEARAKLSKCWVHVKHLLECIPGGDDAGFASCYHD